MYACEFNLRGLQYRSSLAEQSGVEEPLLGSLKVTQRDSSTALGMTAQTTLAQSLQNHARVSVPKLKMRCCFPERTKIRSTIRHRDLARVQFSNPRQTMLSQGSSTILRAKRLSKHRPTRDRPLSSPQKSVGPDVNCSGRRWADLDQQETARTELLQPPRGAAKIHGSARFAPHAMRPQARP